MTVNKGYAESADQGVHMSVHLSCLEIQAVTLVCCSKNTHSYTSTLCLKKVPTFKLSVALSNLNRFLKFLHCWKACEICYKSCTTLPTSP